MVMTSARARRELLPTKRAAVGPRLRMSRGAGGRMSGGEVSCTREDELASDQPKNQAPNARAKRQLQSRSDWTVRLSEMLGLTMPLVPAARTYAKTPPYRERE